MPQSNVKINELTHLNYKDFLTELKTDTSASGVETANKIVRHHRKFPMRFDVDVFELPSRNLYFRKVKLDGNIAYFLFGDNDISDITVVYSYNMMRKKWVGRAFLDQQRMS